ncbi:MAG TPA: riboflavin biosynthesis protein RibF [Candidatus Izemoplasmatales bacterium]|nr:riboflavin biosynthesis protein RibF [Candidatus Izemoplasmatales bacterium]
MEIIRLQYDSRIEEEGTVLCIGFFDGLHLAHRRLAEEAMAIAKAKDRAAGFMTFTTHVLSFIKNEPFYFLTPIEAKIAYAEAAGFAYFYLLEVDWGLVGQDPEVFISRFLSKVDTVVVGFDFSFGVRGLGTPDLLRKQKEFSTVILPEMRYREWKIGSTGIRRFLKEGDLVTANQLLGTPYAIRGRVVAGKGRGKILGYPTINLDYDGYLLPKSGVYATRIDIDGIQYGAMTNVGNNPTFSEQTVTLEAHVFGYDGIAYDKTVTVTFLAFVRDEIRFPDKERLITQMAADRIAVLKQLEKEKIE